MAEQSPSLDELDLALLTALREQPRAGALELSRLLRVARATVSARLRRLEEGGVITGYTAQVDPHRYGYGLSAYVHLKIAQPAWKQLRTRLMTIAEVEHAALVSGDSDIVLLVRTRDIATLRELVLNSFQNMPEVLSTQTVLIFDDLRNTRHNRSLIAGGMAG